MPLRQGRVTARRTTAAVARGHAIASIRTLVAGLSRSARAIEQRTGVTNAQLFILQQLAEGAVLSVNDLAARAKTKQSTVSIVVARLVRAGLVHKRRSAADGRRTALSLTPAGRRKLRGAPAPPTALLLDAIASLPARDARELASGARALVRALGLGAVEPEFLFERGSRRRSGSRNKSGRLRARSG